MARRSITVPIVLLVIAAALIATTTQFTIMFNGPPPGPGPLPLARLAEALRTGIVPATAQARMTVARTQEDKFGREKERPSPARDAAIARLIGVPVERIHGLYQFPARDPEQDMHGSFTVALEDGNGWIVASSLSRPAFTRWHLARLLGMLGVLLVLSLLAWGVARRISRPIRELAGAATRVRLGARQPIPQKGPREVHELARALDSMQERILHEAENRSAMLGAIAHDLGTPLSRIAFWVEQLPDDARLRAEADIEEMRAMLKAALSFTRDGRDGAPHEKLDLGSLIESLVDDLATAGKPVSVEAGPRAVVRGNSAALRRLFANLIENAVRYGERARLRWSLAEGKVDVLVEDDGRGFDLARAEALFAPFVRGETSRNRETGGTGLGLAIVRSIAEAHGGEVSLENRPDGGGRVRVRLPA
ncbi:signal transduction histidine kinase [Sphingomonas kyeonggiensis]|uniref:ATP-binding protein n=1 Tax=Sphingomonas kyeonggiensis TaxID=1268553 RepID=UPI00278AE477|nr:ATP-binding protein [Sphingomonas kyeonggiensis]MDQ0250166.1 signal transduction histidine kinase [Sphingomonas kyeonggiensis]